MENTVINIYFTDMRGETVELCANTRVISGRQCLIDSLKSLKTTLFLLKCFSQTLGKTKKLCII